MPPAFNTPLESYVTTLPFTALEGKVYSLFSYICTIKVKNKIYFKPNASQVVHFQIQPTLPLTFKTSENELIFPYPIPHLLIPISTPALTLNFLQVYQTVKTEPSSSSVIVQNVTHHSAILSPVYIGYSSSLS